jgi:hypothetical protein
MKYLSVLLTFILFSAGAYAQSANTISVVYGVAGTITGTTGQFPISEGKFSPFTVRSGMRIGVTYERNLSKAFSIEVGLLFNPEKAQYTYIYAADAPYVQSGHLNMVSFQVLGKYYFFKYFFIDAGLSADSQPNSNDSDYRQMFDQSGLGIEAGFGARVTTGHLSFAINPFWHDHFTASLGPEDSNMRLTDAGVKFSVGYNF